MNDTRQVPEPTPADDPANPQGLLSEQARWMVTFALGMALVAAMIANWRFVFLAPLLVIWFSLPYLFAVEPPKEEGSNQPPNHDGWT
ncbi:MAG: hypothetical protein AAFZ65_04295 [Planctomycetota bacterium]